MDNSRYRQSSMRKRVYDPNKVINFSNTVRVESVEAKCIITDSRKGVVQRAVGGSG